MRGFYLFALIGCLIAASACNQQEQKTTAPVAVAKKPDFADPFRFHKLIEVSPGEDYDVLSWGRGSTAQGSFLILHSDSSGKKYTTTTGDLDGAIVDVYNSDMDLDGNPEILIQAKAKDTAKYATIYAFEFNNGRANRLDFPKLTSSQRKGYHGDDNFYIKEGKFMRDFPIYDKDAKPTGQKRVLEYGLRGNNFTVKQLSTDSTDNKTSATKSTTAKSTTTTASAKSSSKSEKKETTSKKKSKKHTEEKNTKKKKKKHHRKQQDRDESDN
jgi:hypothetical protein